MTTPAYGDIAGALVSEVDASTMVPGSKRLHCHNCLREVWIGPAGQRAMLTDGCRPVCLDCLPTEEIWKPAPGAIEELRRMGIHLTAGEITLRLRREQQRRAERRRREFPNN